MPYWIPWNNEDHNKVHAGLEDLPYHYILFLVVFSTW